MDGGVSVLPEEVLEEVFKNLSLIDLFRIQRVCRFWKLVSANVLKRLKIDYHLDVLSFKQEPGTIEESRSSFERAFTEWKSKWTSVPDVALVAVSEYNHEIHGRLRNVLLPSKCRILIIQDLQKDGVIHYDATKSLQTEKKIFSTICLPDITPKANVSFLAIPKNAENEEWSEFAASFKKKVEDPHLKLLLVFTTVNGFKLYNRMIEKGLDKAAESGVVVAGGFCKPIYYDPDFPLRPDCEMDFATMLVGGENVQAASVLIFDIAAVTETQLQRLKAATIPYTTCENHVEKSNHPGYCAACRSTTIGFIMSSYVDQHTGDSFEGWGQGPYGVSNTFTRIMDCFHDYFPNVPVFGGLLKKEIGASINLDGIKGSRKEGINLFHREDYTVVSVLVLQ